MKPTSALVMILLSASAAPALAQYPSPPPPPQTRTPQPSVAPKADGAAEEKPAEAGARPSKKALKAIIALQNAYQEDDEAAVAPALAAAKAAATTVEDHYVIGQIQLTAAIAANDRAAIGAAIETIAASKYLPGPKVAELFIAHGNGLSETKQYAEAAAAFERGLAFDPSNLALLGNLGEARFAQGRPAEAVQQLQKLIAATIATGAKPAENVYKRAVSIANDAKLPVTAELARSWVAAYPSPDSWRNAIAIYQNLNRPDVEGTLNLLRLMRAAGALSRSADYSLYASAAAEQGNFTEAQAVIDEGLAKNAFTPSSPVLKDIIAGLKSKSIPTAADLDAASKDAKTGTALVRVGDRYFGSGNYAKAAELYRQAKGKPGVDQGLVDLHLGMALARSGDKAGASAALGQVSGALAPIAQYWLVYVNQLA